MSATEATEPTEATQQRTPIRAKQRLGDIVFSRAALISGSVILLILALVAIFLVAQSLPAVVADPGDFIGQPASLWDYVWPLVFGTLWSAALALVMALPLAVGIALFISHYAPRRLAQLLGYIIDLLAAVPSVVYGLWGIGVLAPAVLPAYQWLTENLGWIPFFAGPVSGTGRTILTAAIVLGVMILPVMTAICREIFLQTPVLHEEAALALGATRWEMITMAVLPFGRPGIISGAMLGLGRALGETMAVTFVIGNAHKIAGSILAPGTTISASIANEFTEAETALYTSSLISLGLLLFLITFTVLAIARLMLLRLQRQAGK